MIWRFEPLLLCKPLSNLQTTNWHPESRSFPNRQTNHQPKSSPNKPPKSLNKAPAQTGTRFHFGEPWLTHTQITKYVCWLDSKSPNRISKVVNQLQGRWLTVLSSVPSVRAPCFFLQLAQWIYVLQHFSKLPSSPLNSMTSLAKVLLCAFWIWACQSFKKYQPFLVGSLSSGIP